MGLLLLCICIAIERRTLHSFSACGAHSTPHRKPRTESPAMRLRAVINGFTLLWPDVFEERYRGEGYSGTQPPYIVDLDATLEESFFCAGQMHKLRELTEREAQGAVAAKVTDPFATTFIRRAEGGEEIRPLHVRQAIKEHAESGVVKLSQADLAAIPKPDPVSVPESARVAEQPKQPAAAGRR